MEVLRTLRQLELELLSTPPFMETIQEASNKNFPINKSLLISAINNREILGIYYADYTATGEVLEGFRLVEPYVYGVGYAGSEAHAEDEYLRVWVIADTKFYRNGKKFKMRRKSVSKSNKQGGWRLMRVDRIQDVYSTKKKFSTKRTDYNPNDSHIVSIIASTPPNTGR